MDCPLVGSRPVCVHVAVILVLSAAPAAAQVAPRITALTPSFATASGPDFDLQIDGTDLTSDSSGRTDVLWNSFPLMTFRSIAYNRLVCVVPRSLIATPGTARISVRTQRLTFPGAILTSFTSNVVDFPIRSPETPGQLVVSPTRINASAFVQDPKPQTHQLQVSSTSGTLNFGTRTVFVTPVEFQWIGVSPSSGVATTTPRPVTVTIDPRGLRPGEFRARVVFSISPPVAPQTRDSRSQAVVPQQEDVNVEITLNVMPAALIIAPPSVWFTYLVGGPQPPDRTIQVTPIGAGTLNFSSSSSVNTPVGGTWLSSSQLSPTTPGPVRVSADTSKVNTTLTRTYTGAVSLFSPPLDPVFVPVTLNIATTARRRFCFSYTPGAALPSAQTLPLVLEPGSPVAFRAEAVSNGNWLSVTPTQGVVPATFEIRVNPVNMVPGIYTGTIAVVDQTNPSVYYVAGIDLSVTGAPVSTGTQRIPHLADGDGWTTTTTLVNLDNVGADYTLRFWQSNGTPLTLPMTGGLAATERSGHIPVGGSVTIESEGNLTGLLQGWADLTSNARIDGMSVFRQQPNGFEAAVPILGQSITQYLLPFDNTGGFVTALALMNPSSSTDLTIPVRLRTENGGPLGTSSVCLNARGHDAFGLFPQFAPTMNQRGIADFTSSSGEFGGLGLRFNPSGAFTSFPLLSLSNNGTVLSQIADGDTWKTTIILANLETSTVTFPLRFWGKNGGPVSMPMTGYGDVSEILVSILTGGVLFLETAGTAATLTEAWAQLDTSAQIGGLAVFRRRLPGQPDSEAGVAANPQNTSRLVFPFDNLAGFVTSIALVNPSTLQTTITVTARAEDGSLLLSTSEVIDPKGHATFDLLKRYGTALVNQRGSIDMISSSGELVGLGLRFSPSGAFTSFPALPR